MKPGSAGTASGVTIAVERCYAGNGCTGEARRSMTNGDKPVFAQGEENPQRLAEALSESHAKLTLAEQSAGIGIWDTDLATDLCRATPTFFQLMGLPPSDEPVPNDRVRAIRHPEDAPKVVDGFRQALAEGRDHYEVEYRIVRPSDGQQRWIFGRGRVIRDAAGKPVRYSGVDIDITDRKRAEEHIRLLMNELNHRINNLLMVIQAIARQTATTADPHDFAERFTERLNGIAASNALLVSGNWQGVDLAELARSQVTPFAGNSGRIGLDGPAIRVKPQAAQAIGMALHELATNAAKHGALANDSGRIEISWSVASDDAGTFRLVW